MADLDEDMPGEAVSLLAFGADRGLEVVDRA